MAKRGPKGPSKYTEEYLEKLADKLENWIKVEENLWLGEFAVENDMDRNDLSTIALKNDKLYRTYKKAKQVQENRLVKKGYSKDSNVAFIIFTLKNVSGWRDKTEVEHTIGGTLKVLMGEISNEKEPIIKKGGGAKEESEES